MLVFPHFKKIAFSIGAIKIHWYGIMYIVGIAIAWLLALKRAKKLGTWTKNQISDLIFYSAIGLVLGGRILPAPAKTSKLHGSLVTASSCC